MRSFSHQLMSWSLHHAASQLTHEFGKVALNILRYVVHMWTGLFQYLNILRYVVHMWTGLFQYLKIQALIDMTPFLLLISAFQSSLLPPCARSEQPCLGLLRVKMEAARCSVCTVITISSNMSFPTSIEFSSAPP